MFPGYKKHGEVNSEIISEKEFLSKLDTGILLHMCPSVSKTDLNRYYTSWVYVMIFWILRLRIYIRSWMDIIYIE